MQTLFPLEASILSARALLAVLQREYVLRIRTCRLFYRSIHDTYLVSAQEGLYYYKVYLYGLRTHAQILEEAAWLNHLAGHGVHATLPVARRDGRYALAFPTLQGERYGVLYTSVGAHPFDSQPPTDALDTCLGQYIARLHAAWDDAPAATSRQALDIPNFIDEPMRHIRSFARHYDFDLDFLEDVAHRTRQKIAALPRTNPQYGICHGDIYGGNIRLCEDGSPVLFDFDIAGHGWRMYDIAMYASPFAWGAADADLPRRARRRAAFLEGYTKVRALSDQEIGWIDLFTPFRRLFNIGIIYISMANTWGDSWILINTRDDIDLLKRWLARNPVL